MTSKEICWNIVNSLLSGALVFLGGIVANGKLDIALISISCVTALIVAITKFAAYWQKEEGEWCEQNNKVLSILPIL